MGVSNVNQLNKIDLTKLKLGSKKVQVNNKPEYLKMTGSIFNAPGVTTSTTNSLTEANTRKSLNDLRSTTTTRATRTTTTTNSTTSSDSENSTEISSASAGRAAANEAQGKASQVKSQQQKMKTSEATVKKYSADAQKKQKSAKAEDKKFQQTLKQQQNELKSNNATLQKIVKENLETQKEITDAQNELDSLLGASSFNFVSGNNGSFGSTNNNSERIQELQTIIGTKSSLVQKNGKTIYSLQRTSSRTLTKMNKTNRNYVKTHKHNMKTVAQTQTKAGKVAQTAEKFSQIAAMVSQVGQLVNYAGKGLVMAGHAAVGPWAAALIAAGQIMQKVGTVVELIGNYGQTAANITKGAAMAADGNLAGALQAFGSAAATGAAAVKSTKGLKQTFGNIDNEAKQATKQVAANTVAKEKVKSMSKEDLGGLSKKQMRKSIKSQLMADNSFDNSVTGSAKSQFKSFKDNMNSGDKVKTAADTAKKNYQTNTMAKLKEAGLDGKYTVNENGKIIDNATHQETTLSDIKKTSRKEARGIRRAMNGGASNTVSNFQNVAKKAGESATKSTQKFDFAKFSQNLMATAAMFNATNTQSQKRQPAQWNLANDAKFQRIYRANRSHRMTYV